MNEAFEFLGRLGSTVEFDSRRKFWIWDKSKPMVEIIVTEVGRSKAEEILEERGYQWWRDGR